jgi:catechol 2,3-dioxygenase-like lactoylglutathione lyase family enzyme
MDTAVQSRTLDSKPIAPSLFAHFVLRSSNMPAMVDWYSTVLNMHVVKRNDFICFLTYDDEHHRLAIVNIPDLHKPDQRSWGLAHVAYTFRNVGELLSTYRRLKKAGIEPYRPIHHGPTLSMYYHDPDGNSVEMQVDCFKTKEETAAYFQTEGFTDHYTPNPGIEAFATALGGDIVDDPDHKDVEGITLRKGQTREAPFDNNVGGVTCVLAQFKQLAGSDGHFVVFDIPLATKQAAQFLGTLASTGTATVVK